MDEVREGDLVRYKHNKSKLAIVLSLFYDGNCEPYAEIYLLQGNRWFSKDIVYYYDLEKLEEAEP